jgi:hypothetical protein
MATATERARSIVRTKRITVVVLAAVGVLACNLLLYGIGRACGGTFAYAQNGKAISIDVKAVAFLSVVPLVIGLTLVGRLSRTWPVLITTAKVVATVLAVATIGLMTIPARFDGTSTLFLATMHITLAPAAVLALGALAPGPSRGSSRLVSGSGWGAR